MVNSLGPARPARTKRDAQIVAVGQNLPLSDRCFGIILLTIPAGPAPRCYRRAPVLTLFGMNLAIAEHGSASMNCVTSALTAYARRRGR